MSPCLESESRLSSLCWSLGSWSVPAIVLVRPSGMDESGMDQDFKFHFVGFPAFTSTDHIPIPISNFLPEIFTKGCLCYLVELSESSSSRSSIDRDQIDFTFGVE